MGRGFDRSGQTGSLLMPGRLRPMSSGRIVQPKRASGPKIWGKGRRNRGIAYDKFAFVVSVCFVACTNICDAVLTICSRSSTCRSLIKGHVHVEHCTTMVSCDTAAILSRRPQIHRILSSHFEHRLVSLISFNPSRRSGLKVVAIGNRDSDRRSFKATKSFGFIQPHDDDNDVSFIIRPSSAPA